MNFRKKLLSTILSLVMVFTALAGCAPTQTTEQPQTEVEVVETQSSEITITDQIGRTVTFEKPAEKIVSSYYVTTALLIALGQKEKLVGIEMNAESRKLFKLAAQDLIDLPAVGSGKGINIEEIASLSPDVVIIPQKLKDNVAQLEELGIAVIVVDPETLENFEYCVEILAQVTGAVEEGDKLLSFYNDKIDYVVSKTKDIENKPSVYLSAGSEYLSTCTSLMYQDKLIEMAGGINVSSELTDGYWAKISPEQLNLWNPDMIFAVSYAQYTLDDIKNDATLAEINAIKAGKVYTIPSDIEPWDYPTPSSILGVVYLAHMLHPDVITQDEYIQTAKDFYKEFFSIDVTTEDLGV